MKFRHFAVSALTLLALGIGAVTAADDPFEKAIEARNGQMELFSYNLGVLSGMNKGDIPYDADTASTAAANLKALANLDMRSAWPEGSDNSASGDTRALPAIWENQDEFGEHFDKLAKAADNMASAAGGGLDSLKDAFSDTGRSCKGCHDDFRAEDD